MNRRMLLTGGGSALVVSVTGCLQGSDLWGENEPSNATTDGTSTKTETENSLPDEFQKIEYAEGFSPEGPWPIPGYDVGRTAYNPNTDLPQGETDAAWLRWLEGNGPFSRPVTDGQHLYIGNGIEGDATITALTAKTGERVWTETIPPVDQPDTEEEAASTEITGDSGDYGPGPYIPGISYLDSHLYATVEYDRGDTVEGQLVSLTTDGQLRWQEKLPTRVVKQLQRAVIATDDHLIVALFGSYDSTENGVIVYNHEGTEEWRFTLDDDDEYVSNPPSVTDGALYVPTNHGRLIAIEEADGTTRWAEQLLETDAAVQLQYALTATDGRVYVPGTDRVLYAVSTGDGTVAWTRPLTDGGTEIAVADGTVYINGEQKGITAVDATDGTDDWQSGHTVHHTLVATDQGVIGTDNNSAIALDAEGELRWKFNMPVGETPGDMGYLMDPQPVVAHNMVYIQLADGRLYAVGAKK